jgi:hypothetical protein
METESIIGSRSWIRAGITQNLFLNGTKGRPDIIKYNYTGTNFEPYHVNETIKGNMEVTTDLRFLTCFVQTAHHTPCTIIIVSS